MLRPPPYPDQSPGEELASSVSHGLGLLLAMAGVPVLVVGAARRGDALNIAAAAVCGMAMVAVYLTSMLYHAFPHHGRAKRVFLILDHDAIYGLIAGSYTPFALGVLRNAWGWTLLGLVWGLAIFAITVKSIFGTRAIRFSTSLYVAMGWIGLLFAKPFYDHLPKEGLLWLLAGGAAYTGGVPFFLLEGRMRYSHFIWHLFVMAGTACHFMAIWKYAAG